MRCASRRSQSLAAGEEAGVAGLQTLSILLGRSRGPITLVALVGTLIGVDDLGFIRTGDAQALRTAGHVAGIAGRKAAGLGSKSSGGGSGLGHGEDTDSESEDDSGVLHVGGCLWSGDGELVLLQGESRDGRATGFCITVTEGS